MNKNSFKNLVIAAVACGIMAVPALGSAQRWPVDQNRGNQNQGQSNRGRSNQNQDRWNQGQWNQNYRNIRQMVAQAERESNRFRSDFEHQYRGRDRDRNWDRNTGRYDRSQNRNQYGFWGNDLKSDIQRMDEAFERLRKEVSNSDNRNWRDNDARRQVEIISRYAREIDAELGRGYGNYRRNDRDLNSQWRELKRDIDEIARAFNVRGW